MSFPLYLDEHIDPLLAEMLSADGCDVLCARDAGRANRSISDEDQLAFAASHGRAILTHDVSDFFLLAQAWANAGEHHAGIIVSDQRPAWDLRPRIRVLFDLYPGGIADIYLHLPRVPAR